MSGFWKQYRVLIAIVTVFLVLGIAPLVVMQFLPPEQSETELPEEETTEVTTTETPVVEELVAQRPFDRFLETSSLDETEEVENQENAEDEDNAEKVEKETIDQPISVQSVLSPEPIAQQPEKISETLAKPETAIIITPPVIPTDKIDKKDDDDSTPIKPEPVKPELPKLESIKLIEREQPKPQPNKIATPQSTSDWIPFIYFYQQSPVGYQKLTLFPLMPKSEPIVIETRPTTVIPVVPVISVIPMIQIQPVYTPIFTPIIY
jgi:hypothetical protein